MSNSCTYQAVGRLDTTTAADAEKALLALLVNDVNTIEVNMSALDYVSSAGLRVLLLAAKAAKAKGGKLILTALKPQILEVIKISGFDRILTVQA